MNVQFNEGINQEVFNYFEIKKNELKDFLIDVLTTDRDSLIINLLPKIILLHHKQREKWIKEYVKI